MSQVRQASYEYALEGDGVLEGMLMDSRSAVEPCDMTHEWYEHLTTLRIRYDADHIQTIEHIGGLGLGFNLFPSKHQVQLFGQYVDGTEWKQTYAYGRELSE